MIKNAADTPLNQNSGTLPDVSGAMLNWFQNLTIQLLTKTVVNYKVEETYVEVAFKGVTQVLNPDSLKLKPEGQRNWQWLQIHSEPSLNLNLDDIIIYNEMQCRVMAKNDYTSYGYIEYHIVQDFTGSDPVEGV